MKVAVLVAVATLTAGPAFADDGPIEVAPGTGGFVTSVTDQFSGTHPLPTDHSAEVPVVDVGSTLLDGFCEGTNWTDGCLPADGTDAARPDLTPDVVLVAFQRIPLPEPQLVIQPPNGRTLVNFDTNFYTEQGEFTRTVVLLGRQVELRIWPESFAWRFGDGEVEETSSPGAPYPDLEITHAYQAKGRVAPSVDTTYAAQFRVGGGPWQDVAGTVTITGTPQQLRVVTARPVLVGG